MMMFFMMKEEELSVWCGGVAKMNRVVFVRHGAVLEVLPCATSQDSKGKKDPETNESTREKVCLCPPDFVWDIPHNLNEYILTYTRYILRVDLGVSVRSQSRLVGKVSWSKDSHRTPYRRRTNYRRVRKLHGRRTLELFWHDRRPSPHRSRQRRVTEG